MKRKVICLVLTLCLLASAFCVLVACKKSAADPFELHASQAVESQTLYVKKVDNLADNFVMGMDVSSVIALEKSGVKFYDFDGTEKDLFQILAANGINTIRVRVWNDPYDKNGKGYGGGNNDLETAIAIGKRATANGMNLMVDFHYSDFWADPAKQTVPKAWKSMAYEDKVTALYEYTKACLQRFNEEQIRISIVQVGNETTTGFCGETSWGRMAELFGAGAKAVRELCPKALVALHFTNPEKDGRYSGIASRLDYWEKEGVLSYDIFASSYYPYWHGTLENLTNVLDEISEKYGKKVMVAETSWSYTTQDFDFGGNTIGGGTYDYPFTVQAQANCMRDVIDTVSKMKNGIGVCYWEGAWIPTGGTDYDSNLQRWEEYGTGWASSYAAGYDEDVKKYGGGGTQVDNQTFFDKDGHVLESIKVWSLARYGNESVTIVADAIQDASVVVDLSQPTIELPQTVDTVMTNNSRSPISVVWNTVADCNKDGEVTTLNIPFNDDAVATMRANGAAKYTILGTAEGNKPVKAIVSMIEKNFLTNYSFEEDANGSKKPIGWTITNAGTAPEQQYVEDKADDSLTGTKHFHFWVGKGAVNFDLTQTLTDLNAGNYKFSIAIMGNKDDAGTMNIYSFVKVNGEIVSTQSFEMLWWGADNWQGGNLWNEFTVAAGDTVEVGIHVECSGSNAWGKIDDGLLNFIAN